MLLTRSALPAMRASSPSQEPPQPRRSPPPPEPAAGPGRAAGCRALLMYDAPRAASLSPAGRAAMAGDGQGRGEGELTGSQSGSGQETTSGGWEMCRNIKVLANFEPPATDDEIRASALQ